MPCAPSARFHQQDEVRTLPRFKITPGYSAGFCVLLPPAYSSSPIFRQVGDLKSCAPETPAFRQKPCLLIWQALRSLINLYQVSASIIEQGNLGRSHVSGLHFEINSKLLQSLVLTVNVIYCKGGSRDPLFVYRFFI